MADQKGPDIQIRSKMRFVCGRLGVGIPSWSRIDLSTSIFVRYISEENNIQCQNVFKANKNAKQP